MDKRVSDSGFVEWGMIRRVLFFLKTGCTYKRLIELKRISEIGGIVYASAEVMKGLKQLKTMDDSDSDDDYEWFTPYVEHLEYPYNQAMNSSINNYSDMETSSR